MTGRVAKAALCVLVTISANGHTADRVRAPFLPDSGSLALRCGVLIDGIHDQARSEQLIVIRDGRVVAVQPGNAKPPKTLPVLDLSNYTCLPGLIDTHTHIADHAGETRDLSIYYRRSIDEEQRIARANAEITLFAGFTTVRSVGAYSGWSERSIRDAINAGAVAGPRVQAAGFYLTIPGGGGDLVIPGIPEEEIPMHVRMGVARGAAEFRNKAEAAVAGGADVLKVIASGAVLAFGGIPGSPEMTPEEIAAVVEVGHAAGIKVTAHA
ncbi:MAG TPA: amidohydrolase family protein, partial [Woeseiaceae bacterium]|nr:amidohydrolase family protein [Woeseiaceae bacterium]